LCILKRKFLLVVRRCKVKIFSIIFIKNGRGKYFVVRIEKMYDKHSFWRTTNNEFIGNFLFVMRPIKTDMTSKAKGGTQQKMGFFQQCDQQGLLSIQQPTGGLCPHLTRHYPQTLGPALASIPVIVSHDHLLHACLEVFGWWV
jgi:hypothetical protein